MTYWPLRLAAWATSSFKLKNVEAWIRAVRKTNPITWSCSVTAIRNSGRVTSSDGNGDHKGTSKACASNKAEY